jgi:hypothetical protein
MDPSGTDGFGEDETLDWLWDLEGFDVAAVGWQAGDASGPTPVVRADHAAGVESDPDDQYRPVQDKAGAAAAATATDAPIEGAAGDQAGPAPLETAGAPSAGARAAGAGIAGAGIAGAAATTVAPKLVAIRGEALPIAPQPLGPRHLAPQPRLRRLATNRYALGAVAAIVLVAIIGGVALARSGGNSSNRGSQSLQVAPDTTTVTTVADAALPVPTDTTTATLPSTTVAGPGAAPLIGPPAPAMTTPTASPGGTTPRTSPKPAPGTTTAATTGTTTVTTAAPAPPPVSISVAKTTTTSIPCNRGTTKTGKCHTN